ncbi:MAG: hypothetical protein D084_Lepto4C00540G0001 [Leptospirillum sp. Group IV 'UBA BS']|nr:MAG: hypothetical protein D084_Lepto4C00540G0001 [Leptospirillum sp. Group IV 'UBA BS']
MSPPFTTDPLSGSRPPSYHSVSSLLDVLHQTTLVFLEEMMDQLDRWTYETRFHSYRVSVLSQELGKRMDLTSDRLMTLRGGSLLHDVLIDSHSPGSPEQARTIDPGGKGDHAPASKQKAFDPIKDLESRFCK